MICTECRRAGYTEQLELERMTEEGYIEEPEETGFCKICGVGATCTPTEKPAPAHSSYVQPCSALAKVKYSKKRKRKRS